MHMVHILHTTFGQKRNARARTFGYCRVSTLGQTVENQIRVRDLE
jgi:hypothetical protein